MCIYAHIHADIKKRKHNMLNYVFKIVFLLAVIGIIIKNKRSFDFIQYGGKPAELLGRRTEYLARKKPEEMLLS